VSIHADDVCPTVHREMTWSEEGRPTMAGNETTDRARATVQDAKGKVKESAGRAIDDEELEREGRTDQVKADAKRAASHAKEAAEKVKEGAKDALDE
jgi:uncharacterized protein YjbJ (UPF0337 family)